MTRVSHPWGMFRACALWALLAACGAKSGLTEPPPRGDHAEGGGLDGGAVFDADGRDGGVPFDGHDDAFDVARFDVPPDASIDATPFDGGPFFDGGVMRRDGGGFTVVDAPGTCLLPLEPGALNPDIHFLLDRSGSMSRSFGLSTRWRALVFSLSDLRVGVIAPRERFMRFGTTVYPTCDSCESIIEPALMNWARIRADLDRNAPDGFSGTAMAIREAASVLPLSDRLVFVSVTDGEPTCAGGPVACRREVLDVVRRLYDDFGVRTIPVGIGDPTAWPHFQDVADVGSGRPLGSGSRFVRGGNPAEFGAAMDELVDGLSICTAAIPDRLRGAPCPTIFVDGMPARCDTDDGYRVLGADTYEFFGASCDRIRNRLADVRIEVVVACE